MLITPFELPLVLPRADGSFSLEAKDTSGQIPLHLVVSHAVARALAELAGPERLPALLEAPAAAASSGSGGSG